MLSRKKSIRCGRPNPVQFRDDFMRPHNYILTGSPGTSYHVATSASAGLLVPAHVRRGPATRLSEHSGLGVLSTVRGGTFQRRRAAGQHVTIAPQEPPDGRRVESPTPVICPRAHHAHKLHQMHTRTHKPHLAYSRSAFYSSPVTSHMLLPCHRPPYRTSELQQSQS